MELVRRIEAGGSATGIPGTAWRAAGGVQIGPARPPIVDLDSLASPADHFSMRTLVTSRGCPGRCTFCASRLMWGGRLRFNSVDYVLDMIEQAVRRHGLRYLAFKDDTFTADRDRACAICEEIIRRRIPCCWSCETRADRLDAEMLRVMRRAGCRRISIGVESASPHILRNIRKNISPGTVLKATASARAVGIEIRYYMMVGNRGETYETFRRSLDFIESARPNQFAFCQLHLYPGTEEFDIFRRHGCVTPEIFFSADFACLTCFAGSVADLQKILPELKQIAGVRNFHTYGVDTCAKALEQLPDLAAAHMDLCAAFLREGQLDRAEACLETARRLEPPMPGLLLNLQACLAAARSDYTTARASLEAAAEHHLYPVVLENLDRIADRQYPLELLPGNVFETRFLAQQPEGPGPFAPGTGFTASPA
jgi:hypothetical protein